MAAQEAEKWFTVTRADAEEWKVGAIAEAVDQKISELAELWNLETEEIVNEQRPLQLEIEGFGAWVGDDIVSVSDPDLYRAGMCEVFDDPGIIEMVDMNYPVPFHEVLEEAGQLVGQRADNGWDYRPSLVDGARDEFHGLLALRHTCPDFVDSYRSLVESNLDTVVQLNSKEQEDAIMELAGREVNREDIVKLYNRELDQEYDFSRHSDKLPNAFSTRLATEVVQGDIGFSELDAEQVARMRRRKLRRESVQERSNLVAFDLADGMYGLETGYRPEDAFNNAHNFNSWFEETAREVDREICNKYGIPR